MHNFRLRPMALAIVVAGFSAAANAETRINSVFADRVGNVLMIDGAEFTAGLAAGQMPYVEINGVSVPVSAGYTDSHLQAALAPGMADGEYQIFVSRKGGSITNAHAAPATRQANYSLSFLTPTPGPTGAKGATGPRGVTGATGPAGAPGATGAAGIDGVNGATGAAGPTGAAGAKGAKGATGPAGPAGATGAMGANGLGTVMQVTGAAAVSAVGAIAGTAVTATATCPAGFVLSGGGGTVDAVNTRGTILEGRVAMVGSYAAGVSAWTARGVVIVDLNGVALRVTPYAVCVASSQAPAP